MRILVFILLITSFLGGQDVKLKQVEPEDYHLWGNLHIKDISQDGKWVSYRMQYENGDTIFVQNLENKERRVFTGMTYSNFYFSKWYAGMNENVLEAVNLKSGKKYNLPDVESFDFSSEGKYLVYLSGGTLFVKDLMENKVMYSLSSVKEFKLNPSKDKLAFVQKLDSENSLGEMEIKSSTKMKASILITLSTTIQEVSWDKSGKAFAAYFEGRDKKNGLLLKKWEQERVYKFEANEFPGFQENYIIDPGGQYKLTLSDDLSKVFFSFKEIPEQKEDNKNVEIWNAQNRLTFLQENLWEEALSVRLGVWYPEEDKFIKITSSELPNVFLTGDQENAVLFDPFQYEPQNQLTGATDYYIKNLKTGELQLLLKKAIGNTRSIVPSPNGKLIAYFHEKNWWVYDVEEQTHRNLTENLNLELESSVSDGNGEPSNFGFGGWLEGSESFIVYDRFDLWEIPIKRGQIKRLTSGREKKITYRVEKEQRDNLFLLNFDGSITEPFRQKDGLLLRAIGADAQSGYFTLNEKGVLERIIFKPAQIDEILKSGKAYIYREQRFDLPPKIVYQKGKNSNDVFQSNPHHNQYEWGKADVIKYKIPGGEILNGILYYPSEFDPHKKYPMIVSIYDQQFSEFHLFITPTQTHTIGFNVSNYTSEGYFVLLPDIVYEEGKTGQSAVNCVVAAVEKAKELGYIAENKIGLIGHSFGGYEANFIVTQTNTFAAAVSGAAVSDLVSFNFTLNWVLGKPDNWRMETQQWRIRKPFYEDKELYRRNSPIEYADQIQTPLLTWSGKEDYNIYWNQSIEWYLALRNLYKKNVLLLYPNEAHVLLNKQNQKDLNQKIKEWFDYFLKGRNPADWMNE